MSIFAMNWNAIRLFRLSNKLYNIGFVKVANFISALNRVITGVEIAPQAIIGKNFFIAHGDGIVIGAGVIIGDNCIIYHQVTIGVGRDSKFNKNGAADDKYPRIGNNVTIYAGAKVVGDINVGDNCEIGANAALTKDVPSNVIVGGIPAKVLKIKCNNN
ncbi:serine O-acetyltransferase [Neobacillus cucumis]|uniref:Serine acetyltransferase n=1 Tax=Neobacillus cucumis TaxID=1740721 RepID=A0A2N5H7M3_9BACI|nr:serine O-acetyltransferase [Neobacillus cucumis]PLS01519.1 serine O-acetyltransferase [Neobacillus cucumis]